MKKLDPRAPVDQVNVGERITMTKQDPAVVMAVPMNADRKTVIEELKAFGRGRVLPKGTSIRELINRGRRF